MNPEQSRTLARLAASAAIVTVATGLSAGTAYADETHVNSHNAPHMALIQTGQIDDPMEDVLEHTLLFGDGYRWE